MVILDLWRSPSHFEQTETVIPEQLELFSYPFQDRYLPTGTRNLYLIRSVLAQRYGFQSLIFDKEDGLTHYLDHPDRKNRIMLNRLYRDLGVNMDDSYQLPVGEYGDFRQERLIVPILNNAAIVETTDMMPDDTKFNVKVWASRQAILGACDDTMQITIV